jgi:hypothetical protein
VAKIAYNGRVSRVENQSFRGSVIAWEQRIDIRYTSEYRYYILNSGCDRLSATARVHEARRRCARERLGVLKVKAKNFIQNRPHSATSLTQGQFSASIANVGVTALPDDLPRNILVLE